MKKFTKTRKLTTCLGAILAVFILLAAACSRDSSDDSTAATQTTASSSDSGSNSGGDDGGDSGDVDTSQGEEDTPPDPCAVELEASEIGVSEDTITVLVMADVGSPLAPGLFQGSIDGAKAWAEYVNSNGGLACRQIEVLEHDSQINPLQSTAGFLKACEEALALVGSTALFVTDVEDLESCPDKAGNEIGIADIPERAVETTHACSPNAFVVTNAICEEDNTGVREYHNIGGAFQTIIDQEGDLNGVFLIAADLPSAINSTMSTIRLQMELGIENDGEFGVSGSTPQANYLEYLERMRSENSNYAYTGSNDQSMIKWKSEALAQGFDLDDIVWMCTLACYTPEFLESEVAEGTYIWMQFLPFAEGDSNAELATFLDAIGSDQPPSWAAGAWAAGRVFEQAVNNIVAQEGVNGITRETLFAELNNIEEFNVDGWYSPFNFKTKLYGPCFLILQVQDGEFVRVHPSESGTLDCDSGNIHINRLDPQVEFSNGPEGYLEERLIPVN